MEIEKPILTAMFWEIFWKKEEDKQLRIIVPEGYNIRITNQAPRRIDLWLRQDEDD